jgi:hypothetical protein
MPIGGWILFGFIAVFIAAFGICGLMCCDTTAGGVAVVVIVVVLIVALLVGMMWFFNNTAAGRRAMIDQKSNIGNGLERTVTVYTANGDVIAQYTGKIDIAANDGGYVKFDFEGKRYMYYNCFVEAIADIGEE